jgi:hypothetical protein
MPGLPGATPVFSAIQADRPAGGRLAMAPRTAPAALNTRSQLEERNMPTTDPMTDQDTEEIEAEPSGPSPAAEDAADTTPEPTLAEQAAAVRGQIAATLARAQEMITTAGEMEARAVVLRRDAQGLANTTRSEDRKADELEQRARSEAVAGQLEARAAEADRKAEALSAGRDLLIALIAELGGRRDRLRAEKEQFGVQLAGARTAADIDGVTSARARIESLDEVLADVARQLAGPQARAAAIGDGEDGSGELAAALSEARRHRSGARQAINAAWPDSAQAIEDRETEARRSFLNSIGRESGARQETPQPRSWVNLTTGARA